uniref:Uncharacterized protein n=1 Tax=Cannabis sativa TaxID=3483 RepID=A0A803QTT4_CANSA
MDRKQLDKKHIKKIHTEGVKFQIWKKTKKKPKTNLGSNISTNISFFPRNVDNEISALFVEQTYIRSTMIS